MTADLSKRVGTADRLPELDVFGQPYSRPPAVTRGLSNGAPVVIQVNADSAAVKAAIADIEQWLKAKAKPKAARRKGKEPDAET